LRSGGYVPDHVLVDTSPAMGAALERQDWDLVTSDHSMPHFSALRALALVKAVHPSLPFIIVSGEVELALVVTLMRAGADDFVHKSELARLVPAVDRVLREKTLRHDHTQVKQALQISETRYRRLFETAQDGIMILDAETAEIVDINPFLLEMLGYSREQCVGSKLWEIGAFKDVKACKAAFVTLQSKGYIRYENQPLETKDGRSIDVEFVSNIYLVNDRRVVQCNIRDITVRVRAEATVHALNTELEQRVQERTSQLEVLNDELGTFNYSVSHDLCAPLRRIHGFAKALKLDHAAQLDTGGLELIQSIGNSARHMDVLIDALLKLASLSRGQLGRTPTNLSTMVHLVAAELQASEPTRQVEFIIADGIASEADPALVRVILENLLSNAWKFTSQQPITRIEFGSIPQSGGAVVYFVADNGVGFDMKYAERLFGAFQRFHNQSEFPGTGIGLASVQRIVHRHGGRIWARSTVGQGATFYFTLTTVRGFDEQLSSTAPQMLQV
jgi:PAS domain S-box-containing protein